MNKRHTLVPLLAASAACLAIGAPGWAQAGLFLKIDKIPGESTSEKHPKEMELDSWQFGMTRPSSASLAGARAASKTCISDMTVTRQMDSASPGLMNGILIGLNLPSVKLSYEVNIGDSALDVMTVEMNNVMITNYSVSSGGDRPFEAFSLSFASATVSWYPRDETGKPLGAKVVVINRATQGGC